MPIHRNLEDLPRAHGPDGNTPARNNFVAEALAQAWFDEYLKLEEKKGGLAIPDAGPYRASYASTRCDRALWYKLTGVAETNPMTIADAWNYGLGTLIHEGLQPAVATVFPDAESEVVVDLRTIGMPGSAHADQIIVHDGHRTLVEYKSIGGFQFKIMATGFKGPATGPRYGAVLQAAMAAKAAGCTRIVIAYLSKENVSVGMASSYANTEAGRFAAEWHYTVAELEENIEYEIERVMGLLERADAPPREIHDPEYPTGATIQAPLADRAPWTIAEDGIVLDTGTTWMCGYCNHRDQCKADGA
jgi:hypothetical protein